MCHHHSVKAGCQWSVYKGAHGSSVADEWALASRCCQREGGLIVTVAPGGVGLEMLEPRGDQRLEI